MNRTLLILAMTWLAGACGHSANHAASAGSGGLSGAGGNAATAAMARADAGAGTNGSAGRNTSSGDAGAAASRGQTGTAEQNAGAGGMDTASGGAGGAGGDGTKAGGDAGDAGAGGVGGMESTTSCPGAKCTAAQVCIAYRRVGGAVLEPDAGACPARTHVESLGGVGDRCAADYTYECATLVGCDKKNVSCACASQQGNPPRSTCPTIYPACSDPKPTTPLLDLSAQLICEQQVP